MNKQDQKYEAKEICKKCGGYCCKKSGCDYFVSDFESMKFDYLDNILSQGRVSIIASFSFKRLKSGKLVYETILSLRARNTNRDIIDLLSLKTKCASLTENGCYYDVSKRPGGGVALIPCANEPCYSEIDRYEELKKWQSYQKVLEKLVKKYTNMSVEEKIKKDVETLIYNILIENYQDSTKEELQDITGMLPLLKECFPVEFKKGITRYHNSQVPLVLKKKK